MPPQLRQRTPNVKPQTNSLISDHDSIRHNISEELYTSPVKSTPPVYTINLSLPPDERYKQVALDYDLTLSKLPVLFDQILAQFRLPLWPCHFLARLILRGLYSNEQTNELKGISEVTGLSLYLLVAYNVFLDFLMGCTSGAVLVKDRGSAARMLHFRTLDWGMDLLRLAIVQFNFVQKPGGEVIARTIGYVGYVGILTGVRRNLSVSLNFRPYHNASTWSWANFKYYWHLLMVLIGNRPSISSVLRDFVLPRVLNGGRDDRVTSKPIFQPARPSTDVDTILPSTPTSAAYLIFCTGSETIVLEKDHTDAKILRSSIFISAFNHDVAFETTQSDTCTTHTQVTTTTFSPVAQDILDGSIERKKCLRNRWEAWADAQQRETRRKNGTFSAIRPENLKEWMLDYPVSNEESHFVCVMDPQESVFVWVKCFEVGEIKNKCSETEDESV